MTASSAEAAERSRKIVQVVLQRLAQRTAARVADAVGTSESTVSRFSSEHLDKVAAIFAELGLKVVPAEYKCYEPGYIEALHRLAQEQLKAEATPEIVW